MKRIILTLSFIIATISFSNAQEIGVRFGDVTGGNVAVDIALPMGEGTRIHSDISFGDGLGIDLLWDFIHKPLAGEELKWYAGFGAFTFLGDPFALGAVGEIGLEYEFKEFPLVIGADWRPYFRLVDNTDFGVDTFGLNVRWKF